MPENAYLQSWAAFRKGKDHIWMPGSGWMGIIGAVLSTWNRCFPFPEYCANPNWLECCFPGLLWSACIFSAGTLSFSGVSFTPYWCECGPGLTRLFPLRWRTGSFKPLRSWSRFLFLPFPFSCPKLDWGEGSARRQGTRCEGLPEAEICHRPLQRSGCVSSGQATFPQIFVLFSPWVRFSSLRVLAFLTDTPVSPVDVLLPLHTAFSSRCRLGFPHRIHSSFPCVICPYRYMSFSPGCIRFFPTGCLSPEYFTFFPLKTLLFPQRIHFFLLLH